MGLFLFFTQIYSLCMESQPLTIFISIWVKKEEISPDSVQLNRFHLADPFVNEITGNIEPRL